MKTINEYLLSKKNPNPLQDPQPGCKIKEISAWLEKLGVEENFRWDGSVHYPEVGGLIYELGPEKAEHEDQYWISLINVPEKRYVTQRSVAKPRHQSWFVDIHGRKTNVEFEKAIELMKDLIANPNKVIDLYD